MLALAVELARYPFDGGAAYSAERRSKTCGSTVALSFEAGLANIGLKVTACAVGQASAAIFARHCEGKSKDDIVQSADAITAWLDHGEPLPDWPDLHLIAAARDYPARHGAILLPWKAALDALSSGEEGR
ncbi:iron-sulfur cluster assembly scaffold protein [Qipengyuania sp. 1NDH17]|uniref:Iron-sulfur cluster assembly scaffold protein n=2 Tax=Qipengyuania polymorpha TaxID=2867234 RepID=A0ABS7J1N2_9SPHN|nr:iron-sulfur cluster assembly scaffold protein [Qipengyuania polymorpha]MBX7457358.1 iron-sulfur cluster assembly scaffold protein [Qipengyuania polymorpha]